MVFRQPIRIGDLVIITAEVSYAGRTSLEAEVNVTAENPVTGECTYTNTGYFVYVALNQEGKPVAVPPIIPQTDAQRLRMEEGRERQDRRLAQSRRSHEGNN
jgi:acyl-CoA hydrolase